jgi:hypothetical protein
MRWHTDSRLQRAQIQRYGTYLRSLSIGSVGFPGTPSPDYVWTT